MIKNENQNVANISTIGEVIRFTFNNFDFGEVENTKIYYQRTLRLFALFLLRGNQFHFQIVEKIRNRNRVDENGKPIVNKDKILKAIKNDLQSLKKADKKVLDHFTNIIADHTFGKQSLSDKKIRNIYEEGIFSNLDIQDFKDFLNWLKRAPLNYTNGKNFKFSTYQLYKNNFLRFLMYWNILGFTNVTKYDLKKFIQAASVSNRKFDDPNARHKNIPKDFGPRMLKAAYQQTLPKVYPRPKSDLKHELLDWGKNNRTRLNILRSQTLVWTFLTTALRLEDVCNLTIDDVFDSPNENGLLALKVQKSNNQLAYIYINQQMKASASKYLVERSDHSPWLFIQHGGKNGGKPDALQDQPHLYAQVGKKAKRGYGHRLGAATIQRMLRDIGVLAGYLVEETVVDANGKPYKIINKEKSALVSPHIFRHWVAQNLIDTGASINEVQSILAHASSDTTKKFYATKPNESMVIQHSQNMIRQTALEADIKPIE
jgi:site-specific recombinase XerD